MVFPTFFNLSLNLAIRSSWSEPQSAPGLVFADCIDLLHLWLQRICCEINSVVSNSLWPHGLYSPWNSPGQNNGVGNPFSSPGDLIKEYNQSDLSIDHLVMSMCRVVSCFVGRGCLLWPVHSLGKTLLAFTLLHFVLQGQICLLLQVSLDFLLLHVHEKDIFFGR